MSSCSFSQHQMSVASPKAVKHVVRVDLFSAKAHLLREWCLRGGLERSGVSFSPVKAFVQFKAMWALLSSPPCLEHFTNPSLKKESSSV